MLLDPFCHCDILPVYKRLTCGSFPKVRTLAITPLHTAFHQPSFSQCSYFPQRLLLAQLVQSECNASVRTCGVACQLSPCLHWQWYAPLDWLPCLAPEWSGFRLHCTENKYLTWSCLWKSLDGILLIKLVQAEHLACSQRGIWMWSTNYTLSPGSEKWLSLWEQQNGVQLRLRQSVAVNNTDSMLPPNSPAYSISEYTSPCCQLLTKGKWEIM